MTGINRESFRRILSLLVVFGLLVVATGCGVPVKHIPALYDAIQTSKEFRTSYSELTADIPYVDNAIDLQKLDIYKPKSKEPAPVLVFIHGGFWQSGHRSEYAALAKTFCARGFVTVLVDYRLAPEVTYPVFSEDGAAAVNWVMKNIEKYGGDPNLVFLAGHSAGAQIVADLVTNDVFRNKLDFDLKKLRGVVILSGPFDFGTGRATDIMIIKKVMQTDDNFERSQPIRYIRGDVPPMLIINGGDDNLTGEKQAADYAKAMKAAGAKIRYEMIPKGDHYTIVLDMVPGQEGPTLDVMMDFFENQPAKKK